MTTVPTVPLGRGMHPEIPGESERAVWERGSDMNSQTGPQAKPTHPRRLTPCKGTYAQTRSYTHALSSMRTCSHVQYNTHLHTHTQTHTLSRVHTRSNMFSHKEHTNTDPRTFSHVKRTCTNMHTYTQTCTHTHTHTHSCAYTLTHELTHTHAHAVGFRVV